MANREKNKKTLLELVKLPENSCCADCGAAGKYSNSYCQHRLNCIHSQPVVVCVLRMRVIVRKFSDNFLTHCS